MILLAPFILVLAIHIATAENLSTPVYSPDLVTKAEGGDLVAQLEIGRCFASGTGVPKDEALARKWLEKSAGGGNLDALKLLTVKKEDLWLGSFGYSSSLVRTPEELSKLREKANDGDPDSLYRLGLMYINGFPKIPGIEKVDIDEPKGRELMQKAADRSSIQAQKWLGNFYLQQDRNTKNSPYHEKAWSYLIKAAEEGDSQGQLMIACMLGRGDGVERDPVKAVAWLEKAANQNHPSAARTLAMCYLLGEGTPVSVTEASYWFQIFYQIKLPY
jgi:TPR repeat protein